MKVIARTDEYTIFQKRSQRYAVRRADRQWVNAEDKVAILLEHKLITAPPPKAPEPEVEAEAPTEAAAESSEAAGAEDSD